MKLKLFCLFVCLASFARATNVSCVNNSGDATAIQNAVNLGGTVTLSGTCAMGSSSASITNSVIITGSATLNSSGGPVLFIRHDDVTITGLTFVNGGISSPGTGTSDTVATKRSNVTITNNTFRDFSGTNQKPGLEGDLILFNWRIANNTFRNFWPGGFSSTTSNPGEPNSAGGIDVFGGLDHTIITQNTFDQMEGDAMHLFNQALHANNGGYVSTGSEISFNVFTRVHRIAVEYQDVSNYPTSCPGGCTSGDGWDGMVFKNNYYHNPAWPYFGSFAWSLPTVGRNGKYYNNTAIVEAVVGSGGRLADGFELQTTGTGLDLRGNVVSSLLSPNYWGRMVENYSPGSATNVYTNNILCGFGNTPHIGTNPHTEVANYNQSGCPGGVGTAQSSVVVAFTSPNNQSFASGANGTWTNSVVSNLSIRKVEYFIDASSTPVATQEVQDVSQSFGTDHSWLYHAVLATSGLGNATHTITAKATDVSGASQSATQSFTVSSGGGGGGGGSGTTYYVDSVGGSNSNSGTSITAPWQTFAKTNFFPFNPCDQVLFKRGRTWTGALVTSRSGTSGCPIRYGNYGSGALPIIEGNGSSPLGISIVNSWITIDELQVQGMVSSAISVNGANVQILNVVMRNLKTYGVFVHAGSSHVLVDNNTYSTSPNWSQNLWIFRAVNSENVTFTNNTCNLLSVASGSASCGLIDASSTGTMRFNHVHGGGQGLTFKPARDSNNNCTGPAVSGGVIADNDIDGVSNSHGDGEAIEEEGCSTAKMNHVTIARNIITCKPGGASGGTTDAIGLFFADDNMHFGNVIIGACGIAPAGSSTQIHLGSSSLRNLFYNNTFYGGGLSGSIGIGFFGNSSGTVKNNIFSKFSTAISNQTAGSVSEDNNIFAPSVSTPRSSVSAGGHSLINTDPQFVSGSPSDANGVKLQGGSPAIGFGQNLGAPFNVLLDPAGTSSPYPPYTENTVWPAGAFGYNGTSGSVGPVISSFTALPTSIGAGSSSTLSWVVSGATSLSIDNGVGPVTGTSSISVSPTFTTTYRLTATNSTGSNTAQVTVTVSGGTGGTGGGAGSHLYWQAIVQNNSGTGTNYPAMEEFQMYDSLGNYLPTGGSASASSVLQFNGGPIQPASYAFDGNFSTFWGPDPFPQSSAQTVKYAFGSPVSVAGVRITGRESFPAQAPSKVKIQSSDDNSLWVDASAQYVPQYGNDSTNKDIALSFSVVPPATGAFMNWRLRSTTAAQGGGTSIEWAEIEFRSSVGGSNLASNTPQYALGGSSFGAIGAAFDGNPSTFQSVSAPGNSATYDAQWIGYAFPIAFAPAEICGTSSASYLTKAPLNIALEGSNDGGVTWTLGTNLTFTTWTSAGQQQCLATGLTTGGGTPPVITSFTAIPPSISLGASSVLAWAVSGATTLSIDNGVGDVTGQTSVSVSPIATTTFTLTATNGAGSTTRNVTVTVGGSGALPTIFSFTATPSTISPGASSQLAWSVSGATSLSIDQGVGNVTGQTFATVSPLADTSYTLTATNATGAVSQTVLVHVIGSTALPIIVSFTATPATISSGATSQLAWVVTGATGLSINQGVGVVTGLSSTMVSPSVTTIYTLTASNLAGTVTATTTVTIAASLPTILSFTASPPMIAAAGASTLAWVVSGATSLSINQGVGTVTGLTLFVVHPIITTVYTLTATNAQGSVTATATVTIVPVCAWVLFPELERLLSTTAFRNEYWDITPNGLT